LAYFDPDLRLAYDTRLDEDWKQVRLLINELKDGDRDADAELFHLQYQINIASYKLYFLFYLYTVCISCGTLRISVSR